MAKNRFIKSNSSYIIKQLHQTTSQGPIYERDYMSITSAPGLPLDENYSYVGPDFKFVIRNTVSQQKRHAKRGWIHDNNDSETWDINSVSDGVTTDENHVVIKPNYKSLLDFAYYGSAVELVRASISEVIKKFPAELYFSTNSIVRSDLYTSETFTINGETAYVVENPFSLDADTQYIDPNKVDDQMHYFCLSSDNYRIIVDGEYDCRPANWAMLRHTTVERCKWENYEWIADIAFDTTVLAYVYYVDGKEMIFYTDTAQAGMHIRPTENYINTFYSELDDFERVLLNRTSKPRFKSTFETPKETDRGYIYTYEDYIWPTYYGGWNINIDGAMFNQYFNSLYSLADFYDNINSDNIWRSMTHEAIKNLNWTFTRVNGNDANEYDEFDTDRISAIIRCWGRQYDDLKRSIDMIGDTTNVSYNGINNVPDYSLSDSLELSGWETKSVSPTTDNTIYCDALFPGENAGYNGAEANEEFMRRLKLNSKYIFNSKGTRHAIETVLGLFGFTENDYVIKEYVGVASASTSGTSGYIDIDKIKSYNTYKDGADLIDDYTGLPVKEVDLSDGRKYCIPWFDNGEEYDSETYFQAKGGWGRRESKPVNVAVAPDIKAIIEDDNFHIYDETSTTLRFAADIDEMLCLTADKVFEGDICYVTNLDGIGDYVSGGSDTSAFVDNFSHYFILVNSDLRTVLGYCSDGYGWRNITTPEITGATTSDAKKLIYLESLENTSEGNNPHVGNGKYDSGEEYINTFAHIFCGNTFSDLTSAQTADALSLGWDLDIQEDNQKCWYFTDTANHDSGLVRIIESGDSMITEDIDPILVGSADTTSRKSTEIVPYNMEGGETFDEAAANSIVNLKNLEINFKVGIYSVNDVPIYDYISNVVMFYVKQIIPSTTILKYSIPITEVSTVATSSKHIYVWGAVDGESEISGTTI